MAYEMFEKKSTRIETPALALTPAGRIVLNAAAARIAEKANIKAIKILWDKTTAGLALQAAQQGTKDSYLLTLSGKRNSATVAAKAFVRHIGWSCDRRYTVPANWNARQKMLEARLPSEFVGKQEQQAAKRKTKTGL